ncbi:MAG: hypothetical protein WA709_33360 [Stellaceae bacterium]
MSELSAEQTRLAQLWEEHMRHEFQTCSTEDTLATMVEDSYVNHVPVMIGGVGHDYQFGGDSSPICSVGAAAPRRVENQVRTVPDVTDSSAR